MRHDQLSALLDLVDVRGAVSGASAARGRWRTDTTVDEDLKVLAVVRGAVHLTTDGAVRELDLGPGDVAILNRRRHLTLHGGTGDAAPVSVSAPEPGTGIDPSALADPTATVVVGARIDLGPVGRETLLSSLPTLAHIRGSSPAGPRILRHLEDVVDELAQRRAGELFAVRQHAQLLVLDMLRAVSQDPDLPPGWMAAIADPQLGPALERLHDRPEVSWSLAELARSCAMSRTSFAERFRTVVGLPPRVYLIRWRMMLARRDLTRSDARIGEVGAGLGYSSEGAFSSTFTREVGMAPSRYRAAARAGNVLATS